MRHSPPVRVWPYVLLLAMVLDPHAAALATAAQNTNQSMRPVTPSWRAWKVFHDSLAFYVLQSNEEANAMMASRFGLSADEVVSVVAAGQSFVTAIQQIDANARAEAHRRYAADVEPSRRSNSGRWSTKQPSSSKKTIRERAMEDGLFAAVEAQKETALAAYLATLAGAVDQSKLLKITMWVGSAVAPQIKTYDAPREGRRPDGRRGPGPVPMVNQR